MVQNIVFNKLTIPCPQNYIAFDQIHEEIEVKLNIPRQHYYLLQNGKLLETQPQQTNSDIHIILRGLGGKGGFGSMLRAIGAQIEKTTNREACRDLSGRRLRDINEEKRVKEYLDKKKDEEVEEESVKVQKKITKLLSKPKHEFKNEVYEHRRSELTQNIDDAVEQGFKKALETSQKQEELKSKKRKLDGTDKTKKKKKKGALWLGDDLSSSSDTSDSEVSGSEAAGSSKVAVLNKV